MCVFCSHVRVGGKGLARGEKAAFSSFHSALYLVLPGNEIDVEEDDDDGRGGAVAAHFPSFTYRHTRSFLIFLDFSFLLPSEKHFSLEFFFPPSPKIIIIIRIETRESFPPFSSATGTARGARVCLRPCVV